MPARLIAFALTVTGFAAASAATREDFQTALLYSNLTLMERSYPICADKVPGYASEAAELMRTLRNERAEELQRGPAAMEAMAKAQKTTADLEGMIDEVMSRLRVAPDNIVKQHCATLLRTTKAL